jgi:predicted nuclease of restriction endonuclease-like (RecB) superfamily
VKASKKKLISSNLTFDHLVKAIRQVHDEMAAQAGRAVNVALTLRNWAIGWYIYEYEQSGSDRAQYGEGLLDILAQQLQASGLQRMDSRELRRYRQFYQCYPQIREALTAEFRQLLPGDGTAFDSKKRESATPELRSSGTEIINRLSFTHLAELIAIDDDLKRLFYETECMRGNWSVRELKRQIASLYFERSGLSRDKRKLARLVRAGVEQAEPKLAIRDPYVFEFLGLRSRETMSESDLEDALLDKLQEFLLELGHGFCFEARQKRILIGNTRGFVDLVFYHRILKCHVLVELKIQEFSHENLGQLNTYVNWYRRHMMSDGDNPPVGILLCAQRDHALVEYALAGMDNRLFVSKYQLELPKRRDMEQFIEEQIREATEIERTRKQLEGRGKRK